VIDPLKRQQVQAVQPAPARRSQGSDSETTSDRDGRHQASHLETAS
jgi:hypothetical protein